MDQETDTAPAVMRRPGSLKLLRIRRNDMKTGNKENRANVRVTAVLTACLLVVAMWAGVAAAAPKSPLENVLKAEKVVTAADGKESIQPMKKIAPGEIIQYRIDQKNVGAGPLKEITAIGPIPKGTKYVGQSAKTQTAGVFEVSIDNGKTWSKEPVIRKVKNAAGEMVDETVPPAEYTHLRWAAKEPMNKGEKRSFVYRVRVNEP
jgi:uncharacterized repeat protein (TIGR01451 family)